MPEPVDSPRVPPAPDIAPDVGPDVGRDRLLRSLRSGSRGQAVAGVLLAVLGFAAVTQVRANGSDDNFVGARQGDLIALINTLTLATDRAEAEIADLQRTRDSLLDDAAAKQTAISVAKERVAELGLLAGTVPAVGPGIRITVTAKSGDIGIDQVLNGLQELRNAGAEAIEIGDVRVVASTGITESSGNGLAVDGQPIQPPYVLDVIGDPDTLATALEFDGGFTDEIEQVGGKVQVQKLDEVEIATTVKPPTLRFAQPVPQE